MSPTHLNPSQDERQPLLGGSPPTASTTASYDGTTTTSESASTASAAGAESLGRLFTSLLVDSIPGEYTVRNGHPQHDTESYVVEFFQ